MPSDDRVNKHKQMVIDAQRNHLAEPPQATPDPLACEVNPMPHFQAHLGKLQGDLIVAAAAQQALEQRARLLLAEKDERIAELEQRIAELEPETGTSAGPN